jgi:tRNA(Ile)-lysidine synthase
MKLFFNELSVLPKRIFIGFSGGIDSRVLFDVLLHDPVVLAHKIELILVNVNHHTDITETPLSILAAKIAEDYKVQVHLLHVTAQCPKGASLEAFMREERYRLFNALLLEGDVLVTGHHLDDQAETFLLNLMRGSGLQGLSAMAPVRLQGLGCLWRPLLHYTKQELRAYAIAKSLQWLEDPTNKDIMLDRIFLRTEILPKLTERWPKAKEVLARTASHVRHSQEVLDGYLQVHLKNLVVEGALNLKALKLLPEAQGILLLKAYLDRFDYRLGSAQLQQIYQDFVLTDNDAAPLFQYRGATLTRVKHFLHVDMHSKIQKNPL